MISDAAGRVVIMSISCQLSNCNKNLLINDKILSNAVTESIQTKFLIHCFIYGTMSPASYIRQGS